MSTDDLSKPLGQTPPRRKRPRLPFTGLQLAAGALGLILLVFFGFALFKEDPLGGEPMARLALDAPADAPTDTLKPAPAAEKPAAPAAPSADRRTITIIDGSSGARREVQVGAGAATEPPPEAASLDATSPLAGINPALLESSRYGMIPVTAGGLTPAKAYAGGSEAERLRAASMPAIAIVVNGLGIGAAKTSDAILKLPGAVTLAFTPYGADPAKQVERARAKGHEVFLQVPMEPFDYPDNDPGPQTLLTSLTPEQNMDRLYWHLSRFQGYAGIANFMGSRFVATDPAIQTVLREAGKRGLAYFDDGSAARSLAGQAAKAAAVMFAQADLTIDAVPTASDIDRALAQLETTAKQRGVAVGVASALPISLERLAGWIKMLDGRGIALVPLTTAMQKPKS